MIAGIAPVREKLSGVLLAARGAMVVNGYVSTVFC
jgi:hypothetical protein